jgi:parvulin-like peptidyl-prolyl isomerase
MKRQFTIALFLLLVASYGSAQLVASHASSLPAKQSAEAAPQMAAGAQVTGKPVVRINSTELTDRDLLREMYDLFPYARLHNGFPKKQEPEIRRGALQMIIFEELVYQEAQRRKMTIAPERVARDLQKFRRQFNSQAEYNAYLKVEMNGSEAELRQKIKRSLLIEAMLKNEVDAKSVVTLSEARLYYEKNAKKFDHGEMFDFQTISIVPPAKANPDTLQEAHTRADAIYKQAKATNSFKDFGLLAEQVSEDDFHVNMGARKAVQKESLPLEVVKVLAGLKPGQVSELVPLGTAYTIIRLISHTAAGRTSFLTAKAELMSNLHKEKYERLRVELDKQLHQNAKIQVL